MKILNPGRNTTDKLWKRLEGSTIIPVLIVAMAISVANIQRTNHSSAAESIIVFAFLIVIAVGSTFAQMRIVKELKKRNSETSNKNLNPISGSSPEKG